MTLSRDCRGLSVFVVDSLSPSPPPLLPHLFSSKITPILTHACLAIEIPLYHLNLRLTDSSRQALPVMRIALGAAFGLLSSSVLVVAQTYTDCNPLQRCKSPDAGAVRTVADL